MFIRKIFMIYNWHQFDKKTPKKYENLRRILQKNCKIVIFCLAEVSWSYLKRAENVTFNSTYKY